jgi:hypothetical protein
MVVVVIVTGVVEMGVVVVTGIGRLRIRSGSGGGGFLRRGIAHEASAENGGGDNTLDHGNVLSARP